MPPPVTPIPRHNTTHINAHSRHITAHIDMHSHHVPWNSCQQQGRGWQRCPSFLPRRSCGVIERGQHKIHMLSPLIACTPLIWGDHFLPPAYDLPPTVSYLLYPLSLPPPLLGGILSGCRQRGAYPPPLFYRIYPLDNRGVLPVAVYALHALSFPLCMYLV